jgi:hypothetical protein
VSTYGILGRSSNSHGLSTKSAARLLALAGHAGHARRGILAIAAATEPGRSPDPDRKIPLTRNEIAHLLAIVITCQKRDTLHSMRWSRWRRHTSTVPAPVIASGKRPRTREHYELRLGY